MGLPIAKKKDKVVLEVVGGNVDSVTGSCTKIETSNATYLFECGMIQEGHTALENYRLNSKMLQRIKPQEVDFILIGHAHLDHVGLIPALYARGKCKATIIVPEKTTCILKEMWMDCAYINQRDVDAINAKGKNYEPFYDEPVVYEALNHIQEITSDEIVKLSDELSVRYRDAGHILLSKQAEVYINGGSHTRKILFTSDLGNISTMNSRVFVNDFHPVTTANVVIGECTYCAPGREVTKETYKQDIDKIKTTVQQFCIDKSRRILIPTFSLDRMPYILWILYSLYGKDENFNIPVIVDSPLANRLLDCYSSILDGEKKEKFDEMMNWKNIKRVILPEDSKAAIADKGAKIICSSSGMLCAGRSIRWTQSILPNPEDMILFIGYAGVDTLAHRIKHEKEQKTININGKPIKNRAQILDLHSFSSHMQRSDLIKYYKSINCDKIFLVHGDKEKIEFKHDLENAIADCLKSTRVIATNKGTKISI